MVRFIAGSCLSRRNFQNDLIISCGFMVGNEETKTDLVKIVSEISTKFIWSGTLLQKWGGGRRNFYKHNKDFLNLINR